jgi:hypothetical protein
VNDFHIAGMWIGPSSTTTGINQFEYQVQGNAFVNGSAFMVYAEQ